MPKIREDRKITATRLDEINAFLSDPNNALVNQITEMIERYGGVDAINRQAAGARNLDYH